MKLPVGSTSRDILIASDVARSTIWLALCILKKPSVSISLSNHHNKCLTIPTGLTKTKDQKDTSNSLLTYCYLCKARKINRSQVNNYKCPRSHSKLKIWMKIKVKDMKKCATMCMYHY